MMNDAVKKGGSVVFKNEGELGMVMDDLGLDKKIYSVAKLPFIECVVAEVTIGSPKGFGQLGTLKILKTTEGKFLCISILSKDEEHRVSLCDTREEVRAFFGDGDGTERLYQNAKW